jgi:uncharacterized membrane protein
MLLATSALVALWIAALRIRLMPPTPPELNVSEQFRIIVFQPWSLPLALLQSVAHDWVGLWGSVVGRFGWYDTPMPPWVGTLGALVGLCAMLAPGNRPPYLRPAFWSFVTFSAMVLAIVAALYTSWTPVGSDTVHGLQGRYVLPILPLLGWLMPAYGPRLARRLSLLSIVALTFPLVSLPMTVWTIMDRYYGSFANMQTALTALLWP